jgi:hypothetical protein
MMVTMRTLPGKIARVLIKDLAWVVLFFFVTESWPLAEAHLTIRSGVYAAGLLLAFYSTLQLAGCIRVYLASYRETIAGSQQG